MPDDLIPIRTRLRSLDDVPATTPADGQAPVWDATAGAFAWGDAGVGGVVDSVDGRTGAVTLDDRYQRLDADLTALAGVAATGFLRRTGAGTAEARALQAADLPDLSGTYATLASLSAGYQ